MGVDHKGCVEELKLVSALDCKEIKPGFLGETTIINIYIYVCMCMYVYVCIYGYI